MATFECPLLLDAYERAISKALSSVPSPDPEIVIPSGLGNDATSASSSTGRSTCECGRTVTVELKFRQVPTKTLDGEPSVVYNIFANSEVVKLEGSKCRLV